MAEKLPEYLDKLFSIYENLSPDDSTYRLFGCTSEPKERTEKKVEVTEAVSTTSNDLLPSSSQDEDFQSKTEKETDWSGSSGKKSGKILADELQTIFGKDDLSLSSPYQGFDPKRFLKLLDEKARIHCLSPEVHKKNILRMAFLTTTKGNNLKKITVGESNDELQLFFDSMVTIYGLKDGKPSSPMDVTLPRIATVSAAEIALAIKKGYVSKTIVDPGQIHRGFPPCMCFSDFGILIPRRNQSVFENLFMAFCYHQYLFSTKINRTKKPNKGSIMHYAKIQRFSDFYDHQEKISFLTSLDLIKGNKINPQYASAISYAASMFSSLK